MNWTFEHVAGPVGFVEGPAWDGTGLLFSDIKNSRTIDAVYIAGNRVR